MDKEHKAIDEKLEAMEKHLLQIYTRANKEVEAKSKAYFTQFAADDKKKRALMDAGELTKADYVDWRERKLMQGTRFKRLKADIANEMLNVNQTAAAYVNKQLPEVYAIGYNALEKTVKGVKGYSFNLTDAQTVAQLATKNKTLLPYKYVDGRKDVRWNTKKVNGEVLQGILQGDSIPKIAGRLGHVTEMNAVSAIRNARTSVTSAENWGREGSYKQAEKDGIELVKEWISTNDDRTRETHSLMNGEVVGVDEPFSNGLMYPGDESGDPAEVYNCRCTMVAKVKSVNAARIEEVAEKANFEEITMQSTVGEVDKEQLKDIVTKNFEFDDFEKLYSQFKNSTVEDLAASFGGNIPKKLKAKSNMRKAIKEQRISNFNLDKIVANKNVRKQIKYISEEDGIKQVMKDLNVPKGKADEYISDIHYFTRNGYKEIRDLNNKDITAEFARQNIEEFIKKSPKYDGEIYRGLKFNEEQGEQFAKQLEKGGELEMRGISSWSSNKEYAETVASNHNLDYQFVFSCTNKTGAGIQHVSANSEEAEVLQSANSKFIIKEIQRNGNHYVIELEEK